MQNIYLHFASPEKNPQKTAVIHRRLIRKAIESGSVTGFRICIILAPRFFFHDSLPNFCVNFTEFFFTLHISSKKNYGKSAIQINWSVKIGNDIFTCQKIAHKNAHFWSFTTDFSSQLLLLHQPQFRRDPREKKIVWKSPHHLHDSFFILALPKLHTTKIRRTSNGDEAKKQKNYSIFLWDNKWWKQCSSPRWHEKNGNMKN